MFMDVGVRLAIYVHTDAEAAKGIASRTGLGRLRHIAVHYLWVQERVKNGDISLKKVKGTCNLADLLTKYLDANKIKTYMNTIQLHYQEGRAASTPIT